MLNISEEVNRGFMRNLTKIIGLGVLLLGSLSANATSIFWDFSYSGSGVSASGVLTTDSTLVSGAYAVTNITGQRNGEAILSLVPAGTFGNLFSDNLLFATGSFLDNAGITFTTATGAFNLCYLGSGCGSGGYQDITNQGVIFTPVTLNVTKVPEPATIGLFGVGLLLVGFAARRKIAAR